MRKYELMYIIRPDLEQEAVEATVEKIKNLITDNGGEILNHDVWGKRRLAYEIAKYNDGIYVVLQYQANAEFNAELDRVIRITDEIIRHLIVNDLAS